MKGKSFIALLLAVITFLLPGCVIEFTDDSGPPSQPDPEYRIVFPVRNFQNYIELARANAGDLDTLYWENVLGPIQWELDQTESTIDITKYHQTIRNLDELEKALNQLSAANVAGIVEAALLECNKHFQGSDTTVYIIPCNPDDAFTRDSMRGVRGVSGLGCGNTIIAVNPQGIGWQETLPYVVAHEYHHVTWGIRHLHNWEGNILDVLVMEGRADAFADIVYPGLTVPWTHSLPKEHERRVWQFLREEIYSTDLDYAKEITQDEYWSGYAIGYHIVQIFMENNPQASVDEWTEMKSSELFAASGYEEWLATE